MKKKFQYLIVGAFVIAGLAVLSYPAVSTWYNARYQIQAIMSYEDAVDQIPDQIIEQELEKAREYNAVLTGYGITDPFIPGGGAVLPEEYRTLLNVNHDIMGAIQIPKIGVDLPIYHGTGEEVLEKGVGHMEMTALPVGGVGNHPVLTGHTALPHAELFSNLDKLVLGDEFYIKVYKNVIAYQVDQITVVEPEDTKALLPRSGKDYVTLVTCTPYAVNSHRLLVRGIRIPYQPEAETADQNEQDRSKIMDYQKLRKIVIAVVLLLAAAGVCVILYPYVRSYTFQVKARQENNAFRTRTEQYSSADRDELYEKMLEYNRRLYENGQEKLVDAFSYEQVDFSLKEFGFEEEMIGYLEVPKMKIEIPVYLGASLDNMARGAAHLTQTSLPVGGPNSNAVIAAHRGMATAAMFRNIDALVVGDRIQITNFRETLTYQVADTAIIDPREIYRVLIQPGRDMVTLITCNPLGENYERYVVYAERVVN